MIRLVSIALALVAIAAPASADAMTVTGGESHPYQRWGDQSLAPTPDAVNVVETSSGPCDVNAGCEADGTIWISPQLGPRSARVVFLHEVGHAFVEQRPASAHNATTSLGGWNDEAFAEAYSLSAMYGRHLNHATSWQAPADAPVRWTAHRQRVFLDAINIDGRTDR